MYFVTAVFILEAVLIKYVVSRETVNINNNYIRKTTSLT